jgi:ferredoxin
MRRVIGAVQRAGRAVLSRCDAWANAVYTWRYNPLYHSGALVVACFGILLVTGLYLLIFYRIGTPYASVAGITDQVFAGRWIRTLHRYVSDLAIVAVAVHALRMFVQARTWGPRALAWLSGGVLLFVFFVCGWTGYVMVWDTQAQVLAAEGARFLDALPVFSEPISRAFVGERDMPGAFFFLNLFAHIALPIGVILILWIHVSRLARTYLLPPRPLLWGTVGVFTVASVVWPVLMAPEADLLRLPVQVELDVFYGFWLPLTQGVPAGWVWLGFIGVSGLFALVPRLTRPAVETRPPPSYVHPRFCTGCEQCYQDCPYEAISMVQRDDGRDGYVGLVDPGKCVSCGICSGSCAPMGVGPPGRTGRDQLVSVKDFLSRTEPTPEDVVLVGCHRAAAGWGQSTVDGAPVLSVECVGSLHTSVIEYLVRAGVGGVMLVSCPPRDCWNREGVTWLEERMYNRREAELQDRVDRRRLRVLYAGEQEVTLLRLELATFRGQMRSLERALGEGSIDIDAVCDQPEVSVAEKETR